MATAQGKLRLSTALRVTFAIALLITWGIQTILWVYDAFHALLGGDSSPAIRGVGALLLMILLGGMEGLEVAVIDRWRELFPQGSTSLLAAWLAARQLFVALLVTAATLLASRQSIAIPGSTTEITNDFVLGVFNITWTGFTVLWFMQILPKHLAAKNSERYLGHTRRSLFPMVEIVRKLGVSLPGEWAAAAVELRLDSHDAKPTLRKAPARRGESVADIWVALIQERAPATGQRPPEDRPGGATGR